MVRVEATQQIVRYSTSLDDGESWGNTTDREIQSTNLDDGESWGKTTDREIESNILDNVESWGNTTDRKIQNKKLDDGDLRQQTVTQVGYGPYSKTIPIDPQERGPDLKKPQQVWRNYNKLSIGKHSYSRGTFNSRKSLDHQSPIEEE